MAFRQGVSGGAFAASAISETPHGEPHPVKNGEGEDGALRFPGVGHRVDAPPTHW